MSKKDIFVNEIKDYIQKGIITLSEDANSFFNAFSVTEVEEKPLFTDNGKLVLSYAIENKEALGNLFSAKKIGEGLNISSKTVSGAMRKLVTDGYLEKVAVNPVIYSLTEKGISADLS